MLWLGFWFCKSLVVCCFFSSRRRHTRCSRDWSSDVCSSDLNAGALSQLLRADSPPERRHQRPDRKSTRLNSSHGYISYAVFCLKKKHIETNQRRHIDFERTERVLVVYVHAR